MKPADIDAYVIHAAALHGLSLDAERLAAVTTVFRLLHSMAETVGSAPLLAEIGQGKLEAAESYRP